ncbi:hypothetical protein U1Q18_031967 [Sarracenia purpurea var. burkii]
MNSEEGDKYIQSAKKHQHRGLQKLKGGEHGDRDEALSYKVNPYNLRTRDYLMRKKVGIGRFVGIKFDVLKDSSSNPKT